MEKRFTEEQIVKILGEHKTGKKVKDIARDYGISENTFYIWKQKYGERGCKKDCVNGHIKYLMEREDDGQRERRFNRKTA